MQLVKPWNDHPMLSYLRYPGYPELLAAVYVAVEQSAAQKTKTKQKAVWPSLTVAAMRMETCRHKALWY